MNASVHEFEEEEIPTGVKMLIRQVDPAMQPFALDVAREHYAMLRLVRDIRSLMKLISLLLKLMPVVSGGVVAIVGFIWWLFVHVEVHK